MNYLPKYFPTLSFRESLHSLRKFGVSETLPWFGWGLAALIIIAGSTCWSLVTEQRSFSRMLEAYQLGYSAEELHRLLKDAETGTRGYVLTGDPEYLQPYRSAVTGIPGEMERLSELAKRFPSHAKRMPRLRDLINERLKLIRESISVRDANGFNPAESMVLTDRSKRVMGEIRILMDGIHAEEQLLLTRFPEERRLRVYAALGAMGGSLLIATSCLLIGNFNLSRNMQRRTAAERSFYASEHRFRSLCETAPFGIFESDREGAATFINSRWLEITGRSQSESIGAPWAQALHPEDREQTFGVWTTAVEHRTAVNHKHRFLQPNGQVRWVHTRVRPTVVKDELVGFVGTVEDVTGQRSYERALRESERVARAQQEEIEAYYNHAPVGLCVFDGDLRYLRINERLAEINGIPPAAYLGRTIREMLPGLADQADALLLRLRETGTPIRDIELQGQTPAQPGVTRYWSASCVPIHDASGSLTAISVMAEEITERKCAERNLQESAALNRAILDSVPAHICVLDKNGFITAVNQEWSLFAARNGDPFGSACGIGSNYLEVCGGAEDGDSEVGVVSRAIERVLAGDLRSFEREYPCHSGTESRWFRMSVSPFAGGSEGAVVSHWNVSELETVKQDLERSRNTLDAIIRAAPLAVVAFDLEYRITMWNPAASQVLGYSEKEVLGRTAPELSELLKDNCAENEKRIVYARAVVNKELRLRTKTGDLIDAALWARPLIDAAGGTTGIVTVIADVTANKRAASELEHSREQLQALASRLFIAQEEEQKRMSRELHDDLSQTLALLAFDTGSLVLSPPSSPSSMQTALKALQGRIVQVSIDVRDISHRLHPSILDDLGLQAALRSLCREFSLREGVHAELEDVFISIQIPLNVCACLYRIAQEALRNAAKHAKPEWVRISVWDDLAKVHLNIEDSGVGFEAENRPVGLGIISMRERARLVNGEFSIQSHLGIGTTIRVSVPLRGSTL